MVYRKSSESQKLRGITFRVGAKNHLGIEISVKNFGIFIRKSILKIDFYSLLSYFHKFRHFLQRFFGFVGRDPSTATRLYL